MFLNARIVIYTIAVVEAGLSIKLYKDKGKHIDESNGIQLERIDTSR